MRSTRNLTATLVVAATLVALSACGDDPDAGPTTTVGVTTTTTEGTATTTTPASEGGWIGEEPEWSAAGGPTARDADGAVAMTDEPASEPAEEPAEEPADEPADMAAEPLAVDESVAEGELTPIEAGPLRAGSVDDNDRFDDFLAYLARLADLGIPLRPFDPTGRIEITVTGTSGRPVAGTAVTVSASGTDVATLTTTADGTIRFLPAVYGQPTTGTYSFRVGDATVEAGTGTAAALAADAPGGVEAGVPLDVLFLLDATGSMGDEIDRLKQSIDSVAARVDALEGTAGVRFAMTLYRDEGDAFVTSTFDFTSDVEQFRTALADVVADGGGDYAEALDEGLAEALALPAWRSPGEAVQLVFLVADAPPQVFRQVPVPYTDSIREAAERGLKVFPIASSESDDQAEAVFRQLAQATGARFVFLTYGAGGAATGGSTDIDTTDYEELALDDLVVRLIAEEVAVLGGDPTVVPTTTPTSTTVPDGQ